MVNTRRVAPAAPPALPEVQGEMENNPPKMVMLIVLRLSRSMAFSVFCV